MGTHWIAYRNIDKNYSVYFDSFGLIMPYKIRNYSETSGKTIYYSGDEIQERVCIMWIFDVYTIYMKDRRVKLY